MKKYIKPSMDIVKLENVSLLAASGCKRLRIYTLPFIVKVLTFAP